MVIKQALLKIKKPLVLVIVIAVLLNVVTFSFAFSEIFKPEQGIFARDFSAYYIGEWRLFHNPTAIYYGGVLPGDYQILPKPQTFKYTPSFLLLFAPFFSLNYQDALVAFDIFQVALVPALAFFVYKLVNGKKLNFAAVAAATVLIQPFPTPPINQGAINFLQSRFFSLNAQSFSPSYYAGYTLANAHVLQTTLLVGALYFGFSKRPWLSALFFALGAFDPRAALLALPLLLWFNRQQILQFIGGAVAFLAITNLPFFFYQGIGFTFLKTETQGFIIKQMYPYDWIPMYSVVILTVIEILSISNNAKAVFPSHRLNN